MSLPPEVTARVDTRQLGAEKLRRMQVVVASGPDKGRRFAFDQADVPIGAHPSNALRLNDTTVSRFHARLLQTTTGLYVRDLGSTNGTWLMGRRVESAQLLTQDQLTVGSTQLEIKLLDEAFEVAESGADHCGELVGQSRPMRQLFALLERVAPSDAPVLIEGAPGTGKELCARALHQSSRRAQGPFAVLDCGQRDLQRIELDLCGVLRDDGTGRPGVAEVAQGGTLFLDEVAELPPDLQGKLLRVLESREVQRLGAAKATPVDVRVIAATDRPLESLVDGHRFREELFYRLAVVRVRMPAVDERREDIPLLVDKVLAELGAPGPALVLPPEVRAALGRRPWPGNVRELRNAVARAVYYPEGDAQQRLAPSQIDVDDVDLQLPYKEAKERLNGTFEQRYLKALLAATAGNVSQASRQSGINRTHLQAMLKRHGLRGREG